MLVSLGVTYGGEYQELQLKLKTESDGFESMIIYAPVEQDMQVGKIVSFDMLLN